MTELFLAIITLITTQIKGQDRPVALIYCLISHVAYYCGSILPESIVYHFMASCEALLVVLLVCFRGCSVSKLTDLLIPASLTAVLIDVYGWNHYYNSLPLAHFNGLIILYYCVIIAIFIYTAVRYDGLHHWNARFLRDNPNHIKTMGAPH